MVGERLCREAGLVLAGEVGEGEVAALRYAVRQAELARQILGAPAVAREDVEGREGEVHHRPVGRALERADGLPQQHEGRRATPLAQPQHLQPDMRVVIFGKIVAAEEDHQVVAADRAFQQHLRHHLRAAAPAPRLFAARRRPPRQPDRPRPGPQLVLHFAKVGIGEEITVGGDRFADLLLQSAEGDEAHHRRPVIVEAREDMDHDLLHRAYSRRPFRDDSRVKSQ